MKLFIDSFKHCPAVAHRFIKIRREMSNFADMLDKMKHKTGSLLLGLRDSIPIGMGYMAVAFSLGIIARNAGISPATGFVSSLLTRASAGEYAVYTFMGAGAAYLEVIAVCFIANLRYLLMGAALSQKFSPTMPQWKRIIAACCITDEIFGISVAYKGHLPLSYPLGATVLAGTMWGLGTALGIAAGNILPAPLVSALSVALYGMFIAIIIPPCKKDVGVFVAVMASFTISYALSKISFVAKIGPGIRIAALTLIIASAAAIIRPIGDEKEEEA